MKVAHRLLVSFGILFVFVATISAVLYWHLIGESNSRTRINCSVEQMRLIQSAHRSASIALRKLDSELPPNISLMDSHWKSVFTSLKELHTLIDKELLLVPPSEKVEESSETALVTDLNTRCKKLFEQSRSVVILRAQGKTTEAEALFRNMYNAQFLCSVSPAMLALASEERTEIQRTLSANARRNANAWTLATALAGLALVSYIVIVLLLTRRIMAPLAILREAAFGAKEGVHPRLSTLANDDFGQVGRAFADMYDKLTRTSISLAQIDSIFASMVDMLIVLNPDGTIRTVNRSTCDTLGHPLDNLKHKHIGELLPDRESLGSTLEAVRNGKTESIGTTFTASNGREISVVTSVSPVFQMSNTLEAIVLVAKDMTEQQRAFREMERARTLAEEASKAKSAFLTKMSHELRTPLNGIIGFSELAVEIESSEKVGEYLNYVLSESRVMLDLVNGLLDQAKIATGQLKLESREFSLQDCLAQFIGMTEHQARFRGLFFKTRISTDLPDRLVGDSRRLRQILRNFVDNAIKFTEAGGIILRVKVEQETDTDVALRFEVQDSGVGIPEEELPHVFDSFHQVNGVTSRFCQGSGLGTTIARELAQMMKGDAGVESEVGIGSTFWCTVRLAKPAPNSAIDRTSSGKSRQPGLRHRFPANILLVEDNNSSRALASAHLDRLNCGYVATENGFLAVRHFETSNFDMVLMDIQLPTINGFEATRRMRAYERINKKPRTPIIALTAHAGQEFRDKCISADMDDLLEKPFRKRDIVEMFEKWLISKQNNQEVTSLPDRTPSTTQPENDVMAYRDVVRMLSGNADMALDILREFIGHSRKHLAELNKAVQQSNPAAVEYLGHTMKGGALSLSANRFAKTAADIEKRGKNRNLHEMSHVLEELQTRLHEIEEFYRSICSSSTRKLIY